MAQLNDLLVNGASRLIGDTFATSLQTNKLKVPTSAGGTTYGPGSNGQVLKSNGTSVYWGSDNNTTYSNATTSAAGLMSAADKTKLNGIATGATANTGTVTSVATSGAITGGTITTTGTISHSTASGYKHIPSGGSSGQILRWSADGTAAWGSDTDTKNTAGSTNSTNKLFLTGATSQAANPQTYSNSAIYTTNGLFNANTIQIAEHAQIQYNSADQSIDIVFI